MHACTHVIDFPPVETVVSSTRAAHVFPNEVPNHWRRASNHIRSSPYSRDYNHPRTFLIRNHEETNPSRDPLFSGVFSEDAYGVGRFQKLYPSIGCKSYWSEPLVTPHGYSFLAMSQVSAAVQTNMGKHGSPWHVYPSHASILRPNTHKKMLI